MKRRANIAAALVMEPDILIMDEPTAGLDAKNRRDILLFIKALAAGYRCKPLKSGANITAVKGTDNAASSDSAAHSMGPSSGVAHSTGSSDSAARNTVPLGGDSRDRPLTVVFTSHQAGEFELICDRIVLLESGKKVYDGQIDDIYGHFSDKFELYENFSNYNINNLTIDDILYMLGSKNDKFGLTSEPLC
jgi:ABC-type uncharacterized transport system ATPase subunit